jgi:hypothetical protein
MYHSKSHTSKHSPRMRMAGRGDLFKPPTIANSDQVTIFVKKANTEPLPIKVGRYETVEMVKSNIRHAWGIPLERQQLFSKANQLINNHTLDACQISNGSLIYLIVHPQTTPSSRFAPGSLFTRCSKLEPPLDEQCFTKWEDQMNSTERELTAMIKNLNKKVDEQQDVIRRLTSDIHHVETQLRIKSQLRIDEGGLNGGRHSKSMATRTKRTSPHVKLHR